MKRLLFVMVFLGAAAPVSAQLRTLCSDPTMSYCASFWSWSYLELATVDGFDGHARIRTDVELSGSGFVGASGMFKVYALANCGSDYGGAWASFDGAGMYVVGDGPGCAGSQSSGTAADVYGLRFVDTSGDGATVVTCDVDCFEAGTAEIQAARVTASVPEPATALLLAPALLYGWTRRRGLPTTSPESERSAVTTTL